MGSMGYTRPSSHGGNGKVIEMVEQPDDPARQGASRRRGREHLVVDVRATGVMPGEVAAQVQVELDSASEEGWELQLIQPIIYNSSTTVPAPDLLEGQPGAGVRPGPPGPGRGVPALEHEREPVKRGGVLRRTFEAFYTRNYRLFYVGQTISVVGTWMQRVAQDWLILELGGGAVGLAIGLALQSGPVLLSRCGAAISDRYDTRKVLLVSQLFFAVLALILGVLVLTDRATLQLVYVMAFLLGVANVIEAAAPLLRFGAGRDEGVRQRRLVEQLDQQRGAADRSCGGRAWSSG